MADRAGAAWLYRRVAFGPAAGEFDALGDRTVDEIIDRLVDPDAHGVPPAPDPWAALALDDLEADGASARTVVAAWVQAMVDTPRPLEEWLRWFWHGHLVSSLRVVRYPQVMVDQLRLFGRLGLGDLPSLLRAVTVDPAMLVYLDGTVSHRRGVNENYSRELLELFTLGIGAYGEDDVAAGARALTGWVVELDGRKRPARSAHLVPGRHDDTPQRYLGRDGVHDVDTVIEAVTGHPACARFVTGRLARAILGPDLVAAPVDAWAASFATSGLQVRPLVRRILEWGVGRSRDVPIVRSPVAWLVAMIKATGPSTAAAVTATVPHLRAAGQFPMDPPNVAGWPGGRAWLTTSGTQARWNMAVALANQVPAGAPVRHTGDDLDRLAAALGCPGPFSAATGAALVGLRAGDRYLDPVLAFALGSPETVLA